MDREDKIVLGIVGGFVLIFCIWSYAISHLIIDEINYISERGLKAVIERIWEGTPDGSSIR